MKNRIFVLDVSVLKDKEHFDNAYRAQRPERRERVDRMRFENGKRLVLGAGIVMEAALAYAGCQDQEIIITPEGKPTVKGCFFNISDTDEMAVCAVSNREVGIDIERFGRELNDAVIRKAFTPNEIDMVRMPDGNHVPDTPEELRTSGTDNDRFIRLWTIKESVMKWYGLGLSLMPEHIEIRIADGVYHIAITDHPELAPQAERLHFSTYTQGNYCITVCSEYERFADGITEM